MCTCVPNGSLVFYIALTLLMEGLACQTILWYIHDHLASTNLATCTATMRTCDGGSKVLGVFGLSLYTSEWEIQDLYLKFGDVEQVQVIHDHIVS